MAANSENTEKLPRKLTVFGEDTEFDGELEFSDDLVISGKFSGKIKSSGDLLVKKTASCNVQKITVSSIEIEGKITGDIEAENSVEMIAGSKITGNIISSKIRIDNDVDFDGAVTMSDVTPDIDIFSYSGVELKNLFVRKNSTKNQS
jgi:cytoskeletal protein CcmA (bactofilin family)